MKTNDTNKKKSSAAKKLVPAVAMLTTSAVMLASATYAWFTLNKEVEVTGLQMAATTGDSLEITLGKLGDYESKSKTISADTRTTCGTVNDLGWTRSQVIDDYYHLISKIKPASSDGALSIYKLDEKKVYAGGKAVESNAEVSLSSDSAGISLDETFGTKNLTNWKDRESVSAGYAEGYYVDIPMWLRSSDLSKRKVNAYVEITDVNKDNGSDLTKAVRVSLIPVSHTSKLSTGALSYTETATRVVDGEVANEPSVFALDSGTYYGKVLNKTGAYSEVAAEPKIAINQAADKMETSEKGVFTANFEDKTVDPITVFTMPAADKDDYAAVLVVARVWIEGESTYCNDATANQDWNIDFHFELGDVVNSGT